MNTTNMMQDNFFLSFLSLKLLGNETHKNLSTVTPTFIQMDICIKTLKAYDNVAQEMSDNVTRLSKPKVIGK